MSREPLILEIKGNSLDDGPGIRSVVFFKGCPLDCAWCHNPESKKGAVEISFDAKACIGCDHCLESCPANALSRRNSTFIDRGKCELCFTCEKTCPSGAISKVGSHMSVDEIIKAVKKDKPFFDTSGGGVTLSGGEPTFNMKFTSQLVKALQEEGIHILIETCGLFNPEMFMELLYPHIDIIYYDIKMMNREDHIKYCGVPNETILTNFIRLHDEYARGGIEIVPRTPLIPDITDTGENISAIARFYRENRVKKAALLSYNPLWHDKNTKIGIENPYIREEKMAKWIPREKEDRCRRIFADAGIEMI